MSLSPPARRDRPRAYVAGPAAAKTGWGRAREWAATQTGRLGWASIGILLPEPVAPEQSRHLRLASIRGATVGFAGDPGGLHQWVGALIVDRPTVASLMAAEAIPTATSVVVVAPDIEVLTPWVDAFDPTPLGVTVLSPAEVVLPVPEVRRVMVYFTHRLQRRATPSPRLWQMLLRRLEHLYHHGGHFSAESLLALAWQLQWPPDAVGQLHRWATAHLPPDGPRA